MKLQSTDQRNTGRIFYLDFIRVIAIFLVILFHFLSGVESYGLLRNPDAFKIGGISLLNLGGVNITLGNYAVSLFLVLSGAGLMYTYEKTFELKEFYKKRILTIYPIYYITFTAAFLVRIILERGMEHGAPVWTFLLTVLGIDGWIGEVIPNYGLVGDWFVGCILGIYLLFPLLRKGINQKPHAFMAVYALLFLLLEHFYPLAFPRRNDVFLRAFEVLLGMYFMKLNRKVTWKCVSVSVILLGIIFAVRIPWATAYVLTPVAGICLFLVLVFFSKWFEGERIKRVVFCLSRYSFPTFLLHHFLINTLMERFPKASLGIAGMLILFALCVVLSWAVGIGAKMLETLLRKNGKYEAVYAAYVSKAADIVVLAVYFGRFVFLACTQVPSFDGAMNLQVPVSLVRHGAYATNYHVTGLFASRIQTGAPVLLPIAALFKIFGIGSVQALMVNVLYIALLVFFIYIISRETGADRTVVLLVMGITTLLWGFLELSMGIYGEIPTLALFLGTVYFLMLAERKKQRRYFVAAGLFFGLAYLTKTVILIAAPALALVFVSKWLVEKKIRLTDVFLWLGGAALPVVIFEIYKLSSLGINAYFAFWSGQSDNILQQAGVRPGYEDTVGLLEKFKVHLDIYSETFNIQGAALIVILALNFVWFVYKAVKRKKLDYMDIVELVVYSYFGWWLLITPTEKAWGRRIIIGTVLLEWISAVKLWRMFDWVVSQIRPDDSKKIKVYAETFVSLFAALFVGFGAISYSMDSKRGAQELAAVVCQKAEEEQALICGHGWWHAPIISFYSGIDFYDLGRLDTEKVEEPVYFVGDTSWMTESGETEEDLPCPVELVYEESYTGQRLYLIK